ncbi:GNAT family N-acetyltransferase [Tenacibaculum sp. nBUS_03]|uniref:GNAT family N-acetyltransferase n=1 Tax=Tenacibaculum sp. nBUS_03 TaxID=3395320 RepID=UPI003EBCAC61
MNLYCGDILIEPFVAAHTNILFELINQPEVIEGVRGGVKIDYNSHIEWVNNNLYTPEKKVHLFLTIEATEAVGVILIKNIKNGEGEMGIMVKDIQTSRENQLTSKLLTAILYYAFNELMLDNLIIRIRHSNANSLKIALKIGAIQQSKDEIYYNLILTKTDYELNTINQKLNKRFNPEYKNGTYFTLK